MSANNPSQRSVVLESSVKPNQAMLIWHAWLGLTEDSRTTDLGQIWPD